VRAPSEQHYAHTPRSALVQQVSGRDYERFHEILVAKTVYAHILFFRFINVIQYRARGGGLGPSRKYNIIISPSGQLSFDYNDTNAHPFI